MQGSVNSMSMLLAQICYAFSIAFDNFVWWHISASNHLRCRLLTIKQHRSIWLGPRPSNIIVKYITVNLSVLNHVVDCSIHHCKWASTNLKYCRILFAFAPQSEVPRRDLERPCTIVLPAESCLQTNRKSSLKRINAVVATPSNMPSHTYRSLSSKYRTPQSNAHDFATRRPPLRCAPCAWSW